MKKNIIMRIIAIALVAMSIMTVSISALADTITGTYNTGAVKLRSTIGGTSLGLVSKGATCNILDEQTVGGVKWYKVKITSNTKNTPNLKGKTGWSQAHYITKNGNGIPAGIQSATDAFGSGNLTIGSKGNYVRNLQLCMGITVDGDFGNDTYSALCSFQVKLHVTSDGICGKNTRNAIWNYVENGKYIYRELLQVQGY